MRERIGSNLFMLPQAKTIQIYLPQGNPRGIRSAEMTTRTVQVIEVPRIHIKEFLAMPEATQVGLYFLVGSDDNMALPQLYIGQTGELRSRIQQHNMQKDFWERAFVMLSTNNTITQTHALYLEYKAIETAKQANRYELLNGNNGMLPHTPPPLRADCEELFHTLSILLSTMGQPVFESLQVIESTTPVTDISNVTLSQPEKPIFYCKASFADAKGYYSDDGFVIMKDSLIRKGETPSAPDYVQKLKEELLSQSKIVSEGDAYYRLNENYLCKSPSMAACLVLGRPSNGWVWWINKEGKTLDAIYRKDSET